MPNIKISQLPNGTVPLTGNELVPVVQSGQTVHIAANAFSSTNPGGSGTQVQYRLSATAFGGMAGTTWDNANQALTLAGAIAANDFRLTAASINPQTGTTYTLLASDNGGIVTLSNASPITVTIAPGLGASFACLAIQLGAGQVTFVPGGGVTLNALGALFHTSGQFAFVNVLAYSANNFLLAGQIG